jgi:hypothetical protein
VTTPTPAPSPDKGEREALAKRITDCLGCYAEGIVAELARAGLCIVPAADFQRRSAGWSDRATWAKSIVHHHDLDQWLPDHACAECVVFGELIVTGFRCVYHEAKAYLGALPPAPDDNDKARGGMA